MVKMYICVSQYINTLTEL